MVHLPITFRHVLSLKYVHRESPKRIAYKAGCREWALDKFLQVGVYSAANRTLQIRCYDASGGALADAAAGRIHFMVWFSDTTVTPVYGA
jgi:hypothetical protein